MRNIKIIIIVERLTNCVEVFFPYTSVIMSVITNRRGMKKTPTEALTEPRVVILEPRVFTSTIEVKYNANRNCFFCSLVNIFTPPFSLDNIENGELSKGG